MVAILEHFRSTFDSFNEWTFEKGIEDISIKTAKLKEFPGLENNCLNSRRFMEIKDHYDPFAIDVMRIVE